MTTAVHQIPWRANLALGSAVLGSYGALLYFAVPVLTAGRFAQFGLTSTAFVLLTPTAWGLVHEAIHGRLSRRPWLNRAAARVLCVLLGFSFETVQFGHLMHHRYNGHEHDRPDRRRPGEPSWAGGLRHWSHLLGGHYLVTALASWVAFMPHPWRERALRHAFRGDAPDMAAIRQGALKWCADRKRIERMRVDCAASAALMGAALLHYGPYWPLLLLTFYARALLYSTLDNLPHYGMHGREPDAALNLTLPGWAAVLVLNHNLHRLHHQRPNLPWRALSAYRDTVRADDSYVRAALRQFSGPARTLPVTGRPVALDRTVASAR